MFKANPDKEAKAVYKFIEKHKDDQYEIDQYLNTIADKDNGKQILQKLRSMAEANIAAIKPNNKKHEAAKKVHELVKDRAIAAELRKAAYDSMAASIASVPV